MSPQLYKEGDKIEGNGKDKIHTAIEDGLEQFKPSDFLSRRNAVFVHSHTDFSQSGLMCETGHIYQVTLADYIQKHDLTWLKPLQLAQLKIKYNGRAGMMKYPDWSESLLKECAHNYWHGTSSDNPNWEYLSPCMVVIKKLSNTMVAPLETRGGWKP